MLPKLKSKLNVIQGKFTKHYSNKRHYYTLRDNDVKVITYIFRFLLYLVLLLLMFKGRLDISGLVLIISYHEYLVDYINDLIDSTSTIREVNTAVNRINDILNYDSKEIKFGTDLEIKNKYLVIQCVYSNDIFNEEEQQILSDLHYNKIEISDAIYVVNVNEYIGNQTSKEIEYAKNLGKEVMYLEPIN